MCQLYSYGGYEGWTGICLFRSTFSYATGCQTHLLKNNCYQYQINNSHKEDYCTSNKMKHTYSQCMCVCACVRGIGREGSKGLDEPPFKLNCQLNWYIARLQLNFKPTEGQEQESVRSIIWQLHHLLIGVHVMHIRL